MQAKITNRDGYRCAPNGSRVEVFAFGDIVSGQVAEWALADRAASAMFDPRTDTQNVKSIETKVEHISGGKVSKGGHNASESQIKERPAAPLPTRGRGRPRKDAE